jgi:hypothetical protein
MDCYNYDFTLEPRAKRKAVPKEEDAANTLLKHVKPGIRTADAHGPAKIFQEFQDVATGPPRKVEPELRVTVFCFSGEADVEQLVDAQKVITRLLSST